LQEGTGDGHQRETRPPERPHALPNTDVWWHQPWVKATEGVLWHIVAVVVGFVMMVVGLPHNRVL
jgi:hypothetical protein